MSEIAQQTSLLAEITKDNKLQNQLLEKVVGIQTTEQQDDSIGELSDTIKKESKDQQNQQQENNRQTITQRFKDRLTQSKLFQGLQKTFSSIGSGIQNTFSKFISPLKTAIEPLKLGLAAVPLIIFLTGAIAFLNSELWTKTKDILAEKLPIVIENVMNFAKDVIAAFTNIGESFQTFLNNPNLETLNNLFSDGGTIALGLAALITLFAPFKVLRFGLGLPFLLGKKFVGLFKKGGFLSETFKKLTKSTKGADAANLTKKGGVISKFTGLFAKGGFLATQFASLTTSIKSIGSKIKSFIGIPTGAEASKIAAGVKTATPKVGFLSKAFASARIVSKTAGPIALITTAAFSIFDTVAAGLEEAKDETTQALSPMKKAIEIFKASLAGLINSLTFGLLDIDKEDFTLDKSKLPTFLGGDADIFSFNPTAGMSRSRIENLLSGPLEDDDLSTLKNLIKRDDIQSEQKFAVLKRDLENAITNLEQRQKLLEDLDSAMSVGTSIVTNAPTTTISDSTTTVRPISGMDFLTSMAVAARN